jgi:hypothetical protein
MRLPSGRADADVCIIDVDGANRRVVVDDPLGDESVPRWSRDGRFLFATSVVRSAGGKALASTLVFVDIAAAAPLHWRALIDPFPAPRLGIDVGPRPLDAARLAEAPTYEQALRRTLPEK